MNILIIIKGVLRRILFTRSCDINKNSEMCQKASRTYCINRARNLSDPVEKELRNTFPYLALAYFSDQPDHAL